MNGLAGTAILMFVAFAARTYITGLDYTHALRGHGEAGLLGFDEDLARDYNSRPLTFLRHALVGSSLGVLHRQHAEPDLKRWRIDYLIAVIAMVVSFALIWPLLAFAT